MIAWVATSHCSAANSTGPGIIAIANGKASEDAGFIFCSAKGNYRAKIIPIDNCVSNNIWLIRVCASQDNILTQKLDIFIIPSFCNDDCVGIVRIIDSRLDVVEVGGAIVIDGNCSGLAGDCRQEAGKDKNRFVHFGILRKGLIFGSIIP